MVNSNLGAQFNSSNSEYQVTSEAERNLIAQNAYDPAKHDRYPKTQKKVIAFEDLKYGVTSCTTCAKGDPHYSPKVNPFIRVHHNTEHDAKSGDLLTCTANCGKTIVGQKKYYG
jgi:hypothetical protein